jgi:hypothetical protein
MSTKANTALCIALSIPLGACARASADELFTIDGRPLELMCMSDHEETRLTCRDYIEDLLDHYHANADRSSDPFVACYFGELLTLRNVGLQGYRQVLEAVQWAATVDGRAQTAQYPELVRASQDFYRRIEPSRDAIRDARESGLRWACRASFVLTRQRLYW